MPSTDWRNRITGHGDADPAALVPNPHNYRRHPQAQVSALQGALSEVGWVAPITVNRTTGRLVDGHARVELALSAGVDSVPVQYVELDEDEEALILATLDPIGALATHDAAALDALLREVESEDNALSQMLAQMSEENLLAQTASVQAGGFSLGDLAKSAVAVKVVLPVQEAGLLEQALRATGEANRAAALAGICAAYLASHEQAR